jgi:ribosomal protein S18 acetylase RimI-like enzyme
MLVKMTSPSPLIERLEQYYDAVPRRRASTESLGPFTLFIATVGWPYYARPALGGASPITADGVTAVLARQRELGVPQAMEWVDEVTPGLADTVESLGIGVHRCPLLVLDGPPQGSAGSARILGIDEVDDLRTARAAISVAFDHEGTATGAEGIAERDASMSASSAELDETTLMRMTTGELRHAAAFVPGMPDLGPVGGGSHTPVDGVSEIAGVGVLPAFRRRGLAGQVTYLLAADALAGGVTTVFCSAESDDVARVYQGIGFRRVGTACIAECHATAT